MYYPSLKEAGAIAASGAYRKIPVSRVLLSDFITPIQALRVLRAQSGHCFLLESAADREGWGRYSFLGYEPQVLPQLVQGPVFDVDAVNQDFAPGCIIEAGEQVDQGAFAAARGADKGGYLSGKGGEADI